MRIIAKDSCVASLSCPTVADPEDGSGDLLLIGKRVSGHYPDLVAVDEEMIRLPEELLARAGYVKIDTQ